MYKLLSIILNWFIAKEKPVQQNPETSTQVVIFNCVEPEIKTDTQEPFHSGDDIEEEDYFEATELQRHTN